MTNTSKASMMLHLNRMWYTLSLAGTSTINNEEKRDVVRGVNKMSLYILLINLTVGTLFAAVTRSIPVLLGSYIEAALIGCIIGLNYVKKHDAAGLGFWIIINVATFYFSAVLGKEVNAQFMIIYLIGLAFFIYTGEWPIIIVCCCLSVLLLILLEYNYSHELIKPIEATVQTKVFMKWAAYAVIILLHIDLLVRFVTKERKKRSKISGELLHKSIALNSVSHDIRGPMNSFYMGVQWLSDNVDHKPELAHWREDVENLFSCLKTLDVYVSNLLEVNKIGADAGDQIVMRPEDIRVLTRSITDFYKHEATAKGVTIHCLVSDEIPQTLVCDKTKITQILMNLLYNALKFTTKSGTIILIRIYLENGFWAITVEDEGEGMTDETMATIFEPFIKKKTSYNLQGTGLGLYLVKYQVGLLGGRIKVSSEINQGSSFTVSLPYQKEIVTAPA